MRRLRRALVVALCLASSALPAAAQSPGADLALQIETSDATPQVGEIFTVRMTVLNQGPGSADTYLSGYLSTELSVISAASSSADDACSQERNQPTPVSPGGTDGSGPEPGGAPDQRGGVVECSVGTLAPGESVTITLMVERVGARESYISAWASSSSEDPDYGNNYSEIFLEADKSQPADLGITISGPSAPGLGERFSYVVDVANHGPSVVQSAVLTNALNGVDVVEWAAPQGVVCEETFNDPSYGWYTELTCEFSQIAVGATVSLNINVERTSAWDIYNSAYVTSGNYDENYDNDYAFHSIPADPSVTSDLSVSVAGPPATPLVDETFDLVATIANNGPSNAGDVWFSQYLPEGLTATSVQPDDRCSLEGGGYPYAEGPTAVPQDEAGDSYYPVYGGGVYCSLGSMASGGSVTVTIAARRTNAREIWTSAWVSSSNHDPQFDNNYADLSIEPDRSDPADIEVTMEGPASPPEVGELFEIPFGIVNHGPSEAKGATVATYVPYGLELREVTPLDSCVYSGQEEGPPPPEKEAAPTLIGWRELRCDLGTIPPGDHAGVVARLERTSPYEIWMGAWGTISNFDEVYENDYTSLLVPGDPYPGMCAPDGDPITGTPGGDEISVGTCGTETKEGADVINAAPSGSSLFTEIRAGRGPDDITIALNVAGVERRVILVRGGPGRDTIRLVVAPGVGNTTVILEGNGGHDVFELQVPSGSKGLRVRVRGHEGDDIAAVTTSGDNVAAVPGIILRGGPGRDLLEGGEGSDSLYGGRGRDRLFGAGDDDMLDGGRGSDLCRGGPGANSTTRC